MALAPRAKASNPEDGHPGGIFEEDPASGLQGPDDVLDLLELLLPQIPLGAAASALPTHAAAGSGPSPASGAGAASLFELFSGGLGSPGRFDVQGDEQLSAIARTLPALDDAPDWLEKILSEPHADVACEGEAGTTAAEALRPEQDPGLGLRQASAAERPATAREGDATLRLASNRNESSARQGEGTCSLDVDSGPLFSNQSGSQLPSNPSCKKPGSVLSIPLPLVPGSWTDDQGVARPSRPEIGAAPALYNDLEVGALAQLTSSGDQGGPARAAPSALPQDSATVHSTRDSLRGLAGATRPEPSGLRDELEAVLPEEAKGYNPEAPFINLLNDMFGRGITLGLDKLVSGRVAASVEETSRAGTSSSERSARRKSAEASQARSSSPSAELLSEVPSEIVSGLPPAVLMKMFGSMEIPKPLAPAPGSEEPLRGSGSRLEGQGVPASCEGTNARVGPLQPRGGGELFTGGEVAGDEALRKRTHLEDALASVLTNRRAAQNSGTLELQGTGVPETRGRQLALPSRSQALRPPKSLSDRLAAALTTIQGKKPPRQLEGPGVPLGPSAPLAPQAPDRLGKARAQEVPRAIPFQIDDPNEALDMVHRVQTRKRQGEHPLKRMHSEIGHGPLGGGGILPGAPVPLGATLFGAGASFSGVLPPSSDAAMASTALVLPRHVASPTLNVVERESLLMQLTDLALCLEQNDMDRFGYLYSWLRHKSRRHGCASERAVHLALQSLLLLRDGTGFKFISKPSRKTIQEMDASRKWYFTVHPGLPFSHVMCSGLALPKLKGRRSIHIVSIGGAMQWPIFLKLLAQDPEHGAKLKRVRLTFIDTWRLMYPNRSDMLSMRALGLLGIAIGSAAAQMGLECITRVVTVEDDSLDWMDAINRREGEALAVCSSLELSYLHDDPQYNGGLRRRLFQALKDLRADVITMSEMVVPDGSNPSLTLRFQGCFRWLWGLLHSHDSLGIQLHRHMGFMEYHGGLYHVASAISLTGIQRRWRPQSRSQWHQFLLALGFKPLNADPSAVAVIKGILKSCPDTFQLACTGPWISLQYGGLPMISASAWAA